MKFLTINFLILTCVFPFKGFALTTYKFVGGTGPNSTAIWNSSSSWSPSGIPNSSDDIAFFPTGEEVLVNLSTINPTVRGITIASPGYTISDNTITISGTNAFLNYSNNDDVVSNTGPIIHSNLVFDSTTTITVGPYPDIQGLYNLSFAGNTSGAGSLIKDGPATLILSGSSYENDIDISQGIIQFNNPTTYGNVMSGSGTTLIANTSGTITFSAAQTYTGLTSLEGMSQLTLSGSGSISQSSSLVMSTFSTLTLASGLGNTTIQNPNLTAGTVELNENTLTFNVTQVSRIFGGTVSGTGGLTLTGTSSLSLNQGVNLSFTGATTITSGELIIGDCTYESTSGFEVDGTLSLQRDFSLKNLTGASTGICKLEGNILTISDGGGTFSGIISNGGNSNGGSLVKSGSGSTTLSGDNTFLGNLTLSGGSLTLGGNNSYLGQTSIASGSTLTLVNSGLISNSSSVVNNGTLVISTATGSPLIRNFSGDGTLTINGNALTINQTQTGEFSGTLSGSSNFTKTGTGALSLSVNGAGYTGDIEVSAGTLELTGTLGGSLEVALGALFKGSGTIGSGAATVTNLGTLEPGNSIGTLTIDGTYTQDANANLIIEVDPSGTSDSLTVTAQANLAGTLTIAPNPGLYTPGTVFTLISASPVDFVFANLVEQNEITGAITYNLNSVTYTLSDHVPVLPVVKSPNALNGISGNALNIANYLFRPNAPPQNEDFALVYHHLLTLPASQFAGALQTLGPNAFGAFPLVSLQSDSRVAGNFTDYLKDLSLNTECSNCRNASSTFSLWFEPFVYDYIQFVYLQNDLIEQTKFNSITYGANTGFAHCWLNKLTLGFDVSYSHTNLHWSRQAGNAKWSSLYFGPGIGWSSIKHRLYSNFSLLGVVNFLSVDRRIVFPGIERVARNIHTSFDVLARADGGLLFESSIWFIQPEITLNCLTTLQPQYTENGALSLDLTVFQKYDVFLRPEFTVKTGLDLGKGELCIQPSLKLGWVSNIPLTTAIYHARLRNETFPSENQFPTKSFYRTTNQLVAGAEVILSHCGMTFKAGFDANYLDKSLIQEGKLRVDWWF